MPLPIGILEGRLTPSRERGIQFFPYGEWEEEFPAAKRLGLEAIEILIQRKDWGHPNHPLLFAEGRTRIRRLAEENDITIPSVHAYYEPRPTFPEELRTIVEAAKEIGAGTVLLSFFNHAAIISRETRDHAARLIGEALPTAERLGVYLGFEAELAAEDLTDFIAGFRSEAVGVYYDVGNQFACGFDVAREIHLLGKRIVGVHLKDRLANTSLAEGRTVPFGDGCADFSSALVALRDISYDGPIILQGARPPADDDTTAAIGTYVRYVRKILTQIEENHHG